MDNGYVKLYRSVEDEGSWLKRAPLPVFRMAMYLLAKVRYRPGKWVDPVAHKVIEVPRGCLVTSVRGIARELKGVLTYQQIRTALDFLQRVDFLTQEGAHSHTLVKVLNYDSYQSDEERRNARVNASLTQGQRKPNAPIKEEGEEGEEGEEERGASPPATPSAPADIFMTKWNDNATRGMARIRSMSQDRKTALRARLREEHWSEDYPKALERAKKSKFLMGQISGGNGSPFRFDADFFLRPGTVNKILEGKYDNRNGDGAALHPELRNWKGLVGKLDKKLIVIDESQTKFRFVGEPTWCPLTPERKDKIKLSQGAFSD